jgi:IS1 family transposase
VSKKANYRILLAIDRDTREIVGVHIGYRCREEAQALWESMTDFYYQSATFYNDFWEAYQGIFPKGCHQAVGKETGKTNHIERVNCTLRQRVSLLVRKTLSFSKKLENHIGAIWYFIYHYNANICNELRCS